MKSIQPRNGFHAGCPSVVTQPQKASSGLTLRCRTRSRNGPAHSSSFSTMMLEAREAQRPQRQGFP